MDIEFSYDASTKPDAADQSDPKDIDLDGTDSDLFQPSPTHWKQIMTLPLYLRQHWAKSFKSELNTLLKMKTFAMEDKPSKELIIIVTANFRVKLQSNVKVEKLKTRIYLRGDKQQELTDWDTCCPITGFRELRKFLAHNASTRQSIYQLDFIGAFLQSKIQHLT